MFERRARNRATDRAFVRRDSERRAWMATHFHCERSTIHVDPRRRPFATGVSQRDAVNLALSFRKLGKSRPKFRFLIAYRVHARRRRVLYGCLRGILHHRGTPKYETLETRDARHARKHVWTEKEKRSEGETLIDRYVQVVKLVSNGSMKSVFNPFETNDNYGRP